MLLRSVLSTVCVVLVAPVGQAAARSSDDPNGTATARATNARPVHPDAVLAPGVKALTKPDSAIRVDAPRLVIVQMPGDGKAQEPPLVVLEPPKITCPILMVAADPEFDPKFVAPLPKDMTFTIRSVAPTACR